MSAFDDDAAAERLRDDEPATAGLERTDIDSDEELDGEVDADGAAVIGDRNE
jgi:hypothetical protein